MKISKLTFLPFAALIFTACFQVQGAIQIVNVANNTFTPSAFNINVGDTVKWVWAAGTHNSTSLTIPSAATPWASTTLSAAGDNFMYHVTVAGTYSYDCSIHGASMSGGFQANSPSRITQTNFIQSMAVFPNPVHEKLNVKLNTSQNETANIRVFDILGQEAMNMDLHVSAGTNELSLDAADLTRGIYFLKVNLAGRETRVLKITKE